jgi:flagellar FliL protein
MATKSKSKAEAAPAEAPAAGGSKKKMMIIILAAVLASGAAAGGAVWFLGRGKAPAGGHEASVAHASSVPALFLPLDPFTVNLATENADQFLQVSISLQVVDAPTVELIKANIAIVRNRILILLSSKKSSEINTVEGKEKLATEIMEKVREPFVHNGKPQDVSGALFTSFIVQ